MKDKVSFKDFMTGHIFLLGFKLKYIGIVIFVVILSVLYMRNTYNTLDLRYDIFILQSEIKFLRNRSIDYNLELQQLGREQKVQNMLRDKKIALKRKQTPVIEIVENK